MATVAEMSGSRADDTSNLLKRTMDELNLPKSEIHTIVMDYLIKEGFPNAADRFARDANIAKKPDDTYIEFRVKIRNHIYNGELQEAIEILNDINPELLDRNKPLHFSLLRLQLIELIKQSFTASEQEYPKLVSNAMLFANQNLAPYVPLSDAFKVDLERAMSLLIIPQDVWRAQQGTKSIGVADFGSLRELVEPGLKASVARNVNEAILTMQGKSGKAGLLFLLQSRIWAEDLAREKGIQLPAGLTWGLESSDQQRSVNTRSDGEDTAMTGNNEESVGGDPVERYTNIP